MTTLAFNTTPPTFAKVSWVAFALCITFGIFVLMAKLIENNASPIRNDPTVTLGPIIFEEPDQHTNTRPPVKPRPKMQKPPSRPVIKSEPTPNVVGVQDTFKLNNHIDAIKIDTTMSQRSNSNARPLVRIEPKYPPQAATQGIEGWVQLSFNIAADGSVTNVLVVNSEPRRVFDRAAVRALKRWKYKPSFENGMAISQIGQQVVLNFKLNN